MLFRDHEIVWELGTPARNHLIFPAEKAERKRIRYKLLEVLPPKTSVSNQIIKESVSIQTGGSSVVMKKICSKKNTHFSEGSVKVDMARKDLKVENISALNRPLQSPEKKVPLRKDNLPCSSRMHEAGFQQQKSVSRIEKTSLERPLVKKIKTSLNANNAAMENR